MTGYVYTAEGEKLQLPVPLAWEMNYTAGVPCDSFWLRCPWDGGQKADPADFVRFSAIHRGKTVFTGVVDECVLSFDGKGSRLEVSGRGLAALLLDNEAQGRDYGTATLGDILREHVRPYGIKVGRCKSLPGVSGFSVATGSSEWSVLYDFARFHGGVTPRFDREGKLILEGWSDRGNLLISDSTPVTAMELRDRRYGVVSEILVRDRKRQTLDQVRNESFIENGGRCRRIVTVPSRKAFKTGRYSGRFQMEKSAAGLRQLEITVAIPFYGEPGDLVEVARRGWSGNGSYRVIAVRTVCDGRGGRTTLTLAHPDAVL